MGLTACAEGEACLLLDAGSRVVPPGEADSLEILLEVQVVLLPANGETTDEARLLVV